jgi:hypothetical protein
MPMRWIERRLLVILICLVCASLGAQAQSPERAAEPDQRLLSAEQLDALVAPIALYPDPLVAQVMMASTYPLEVVQADRWLRSKKQLKGDPLKAEAAKQSWDDSVKSLIATPSVLDMMSQQLEWTEKLGNAVLAQETDVIAAVQRLRTKAYDNKKLSSTKEQTVTVRQEGGKSVVAIEPAAADSIAVPYYDPSVVYDPWPYADYQPYYFGCPDYVPCGIIGSGIAFGAGYLIGRWIDGDWWHGGIDWNRGNINIDRNRVTHHWEHNPRHRRGVQYTNANVRQKFSNANIGARRNSRDNVRAGAGDRTPGANRAGADRARAADRGPGDRKQAAARAKNAPKGGAKNAAKRADSAKTAARAKSPAGNARKAQAASNRTHARARPSSARMAQHHARRIHHRGNLRYAGFGGGRGGFGGRRGFGGGGRRR